MTREETKKIVDKIQVFRQSFLITNSVYIEWHNVLETYDYVDVDIKLNEYFKDGDNFGKYPDPYYITKNLKTHKEKVNQGNLRVRCQICRQVVEWINYQEHFDRCSSVDYLCFISKKYFDRTLNREKLMKLSDKEFDEKYWTFKEQLLSKLDDDRLKKSCENALLSHNGKLINYSCEEVIKNGRTC